MSVCLGANIAKRIGNKLCYENHLSFQNKIIIILNE